MIVVRVIVVRRIYLSTYSSFCQILSVQSITQILIFCSCRIVTFYKISATQIGTWTPSLSCLFYTDDPTGFLLKSQDPSSDHEESKILLNDQYSSSRVYNFYKNNKPTRVWYLYCILERLRFGGFKLPYVNGLIKTYFTSLRNSKNHRKRVG